MLKPSYAELMDVMNEKKNAEVTSRYTVVIAAAKRARQLIDGDEPMIDNPTEGKPVTTAVNEIYQGKISVVPEGEGTIIKVKKKKEKIGLEEEIKQAKPNNVSDKNIEKLCDDGIMDEDDGAVDNLDENNDELSDYGVEEIIEPSNEED